MTGRLENSGRRRAIAATLLAAVALAGCASSAANQQLDILGSRVNETVVDFGELETYARRAKAAYGTEAQIRAAYPKTVRIATPGKDQVRYFVERDDAAKTQTISVRGTANRRNLTEDEKARITVDRHAGIPVHMGFDDVASVIYADLAPNLKRGYTTYVTGHSLGGAVAALVAIYAMEDGHQVKRVVTFGQPRFTTSVGVAKLGNLPLTRVVDENDIIPMVPPASMGDKVYGPYEHVGPEIILLEGPRYVYLPSHDATRLSLGEFWRTEGFADLPDHKMDNYLRRIADKRKGAIVVSYDDREKYVVHKPKSALQRSEQ